MAKVPSGADLLVATPEKALFDEAYLLPYGRLSLTFATTPAFSEANLHLWLSRVRDGRRRGGLEDDLTKLVARAPLHLAPRRPPGPKLLDSETAIGRLRQMGRAVVSTSEVGSLFGLNLEDARRLLRRLSSRGTIINLRHDRWTGQPNSDPLNVAVLAAGSGPAYVSCLTALRSQGWLLQTARRYDVVVRDGRTRRLETRLGEISIGVVEADLYGGFEMHLLADGTPVPVATPEKALIDHLYLEYDNPSWNRNTRLKLTPGSVDRAGATQWIGRIGDAPRREWVSSRFDKLTASAPTSRTRRRSLSPIGQHQTPARERLSQGTRNELRDRLREILVRTAEMGEVIRYEDIGPQLGFAIPPRTRGTLNGLLRDIGREEVAAGRPLITSLVILKSTGMPPAPFFAVARQLD